jgi:hypothetical protein
MATAPARQITLRLPESLYRQVKQLARKKRVSINKLAQEGLEALTQEDLAREMRAAYDALATDAEGSDVEIYLSAQREVVFREPA